MNEKYLNEVMHAYSAGCLDHEDLIPLQDLFESNDHLSNPELGELQNLISLLPAILLVENPPVSAKDKIAMRLYALREEMLAKRTQERDVPPESTVSGKGELRDTPAQNEEVKTPKYMVLTDPDMLSSDRTISAKPDQLPQAEPQRVNVYNEDKSHYEPKEREYTEAPTVSATKESKGVLIALVIVFILLIAGASSGVYYMMQQQIEKQEKSLTALRSDINVLNEEIVRLNKVQRILAILGSKDVNTINLDGTIDNPTGFGKIVFDPANKEGLISLFNMPSLPKEKAYQLWLLSKGQPFSLGLYTPQKDADRYIPINEFPDIPLDNIDSFQLTMEDAQGSDSPKGPVYLNSSVKRSYRSSY